MSQLQPYDPSHPAGMVTAPRSMPPLPGAHHPAGPYAPATDQRPVSGVVLVIAWVLAVASVGYMLPWAVAATRGRSNQAAIGILNLFLGWSFIGWVVALVMACQQHQPLWQAAPVNVVVAQQFAAAPAYAAPATATGPAAGWYPAPDGVGRQYWDGATWTGHRAP